MVLVSSDMRNGHAEDAMVTELRPTTASADSLGIITITPDLAREWLDRMRFPTQRPVRERHVQFLAREIEHGRFRLSPIDIRSLDGQDYLVNGQHRLHAVIRADAPAQMVVVRRSASSLEDVARDYAAFDRGLVRSHVDGLMGYGLDEETGLTAKQLSKLSSASPLVLGCFQPGQTNGRAGVSTQERAEFVREWAPNALLACATIGESSLARVRRLYTGPIFGVALVTFRYAPDRAEAFWGRAAENDGLRNGDPEQSLIDFVATRPTQSGQQTYMSRAVAACWNAAYQGRTLRHVKVMDPAAPIRILGTPFDGKSVLKYTDLP